MTKQALDASLITRRHRNYKPVFLLVKSENLGYIR